MISCVTSSYPLSLCSAVVTCFSSYVIRAPLDTGCYDLCRSLFSMSLSFGTPKSFCIFVYLSLFLICGAVKLSTPMYFIACSYVFPNDRFFSEFILSLIWLIYASYSAAFSAEKLILFELSEFISLILFRRTSSRPMNF